MWLFAANQKDLDETRVPAQKGELEESQEYESPPRKLYRAPGFSSLKIAPPSMAHKLLYFKFICVVSQKTWISQDSKIMCMQELAWVSKCKSKRRKEFNKTLGSFSLLFMSKVTCWFFHSKTNISELQFQNSRLPLYMEIKKKETRILLSWQTDRRWCRKSFG